MWKKRNNPKNCFIKKVFPLLTGCITALAGIVVLVCLSFFTTVVTEGFLYKTSLKLGVDEKLQMTQEDMGKVVSSMVSYVKGNSDTLQVTVSISGETRGFFNDRELQHIEEVRELIGQLRILVVVCGILAVAGGIFLIRKKWQVFLAKGYFLALGLIAVVGATVGTMAIINVKKVIRGFHEMFFDNRLWLLNPAIDKIVWFFSEELYMHALIRVGICLLLLLGGVTAGAVILIKRYKVKKM